MKIGSFDNKDRILALILSFAMLVTAINISLFATDIILNQQNKGKTLLEQSQNHAIEVFEIPNAQILNELAFLTNSDAKYLDGTKSFATSNYVLTADIDLSSYATGEGWVPIGTETTPFKGTVNGQGYLVKNLFIDSATSKDYGLFGYIDTGATVSNMGIVSAQVRGGAEVGILAGLSKGTIKNCYVNGTVSSLAEQSSVGGIVGYSSGYIKDCYSIVTASGQTVGGIAGYLVGEVANSVALGETITGSNKSGRIAGIGENIINSYGRKDMLINGVLVGDTSTIINGNHVTTLMATGLWWRDTTLFSGVDWTFTDTQLPKLIRVTPPKEDVVEKTLDGKGSVEEPYLIHNNLDLSFIRNKINSNDLKYSEANIYFSLVNSIDLASDVETELWIPIGTLEAPFKGTFLGNENVIKNLKINDENADYQGLFGYIGEGANISELGILGANITANNYIGAIAGKADTGSIITNCYASADITATNMAAILVGELSGELNGAVALSGTVIADEVAGRVIGNATEAAIINNAYAWQGLLINNNSVTQALINDKNGFSIEPKDNDAWIKAFGKTESIWNVDYTTIQVKEMLIKELNINEDNALIVLEKGTKILSQLLDPVQTCGEMTLDKTNIEINIKQPKGILELTIPNDSATDERSITWASTDASVATAGYGTAIVNSGQRKVTVNVTAKQGGTTSISATRVRATGETDTVSFNVLVKVDVKSVYFIIDGEDYTPTTQEMIAKKGKSADINVGKTFQLKAVFDPPNATNQNVTWTSDRESIASIDEQGLLTCKAITGAYIEVKSEENQKYKFKRMLIGVQGVESVELTKNLIEIDRFTEEQMKSYIKFTPEKVTNKTTTWSSSNKAIATITAGGRLVGVSAGKTQVTVTTEDGNKTATCNVTVRETYKVASNKESIVFTTDQESYEPIATQAIEMSNMGTEDLILTASVDNKFILGDLPNGGAVPRGGKTSFTVKPKEGLKVGKYNEKIKVITQKENEVETDILKRNSVEIAVAFEVIARPVSGVSLALTEKTIIKGQNFQMQETIAPATATNKNVTWESNDTNIATVSNTGLVTAVSAGNAIITVKTVDGNKQAACNVLVSATYTMAPISDIVLEDEIESYTNQGTKTVEITNTGNQNITLKTPTTADDKLIIGVLSNTGDILPGGKASFTIKMKDGLKRGAYEEEITIWNNQNVKITLGVTWIVQQNHVSAVDIADRISMTVNEEATISATIEPSNASVPTVKWTSNNSEIVEIDENTGVMKANKIGEAIIQAETIDGGYTDTCTVVVSMNVDVEGVINNTDSTPAGVADVDISLIRGNKQIATTKTDQDGKFKITEVLLDGLYNLVLTKGATNVTTSFEVVRSKVTPIRITFPNGNKNTNINIGEGMEDVMVSGLDRFFYDVNMFSITGDNSDQSIVDAGGTVEFAFNISKLNKGANPNEVGSDIVEAIEEVAKNKVVVQYMDINIEKSVIPQGGSTTKEYMHKLQNKIEIVIDIPIEVRGKAYYQIISVHAGKTNILNDKDNEPNTITIEADAFSIFALIYSETGRRPGQTEDEDEVIVIETPLPPRSGYAVPYYTKNGVNIVIGISAFLNGELRYVAPPGAVIKYKDTEINRRTFIDIEGHWSENYVNFVSERDIIMGAQGNAFEPDSKMTRAMFVTVLGRLYEKSYEDIKESEEKSIFPDVEQGKYYTKYIKWATEKNIIKGINLVEFGPTAEISREEMTTIILRFAKLIGKAPKNIWNRRINFNDKNEISPWAEEGIMYCTLNDIVHGIDQEQFGPNNTATRAEVSAVIERFIKVILD